MNKRIEQQLQHETEYVKFLERRLASENFLANVSKDEVKKTKEKLKRARFKLKALKESVT